MVTSSFLTLVPLDFALFNQAIATGGSPASHGLTLHQQSTCGNPTA